MPHVTTVELKKALLGFGFEIYRTIGQRVLLADRVRENLIMDSGVSIGGGDELTVRFVVRAQANDFPGETADELLQRGRRLATASLERGYAETGSSVVPIHDPGDRTRILDTWHELSFEKHVADFEELAAEVRYALSLTKTVPVGRIHGA